MTNHSSHELIFRPTPPIILRNPPSATSINLLFPVHRTLWPLLVQYKACPQWISWNELETLSVSISKHSVLTRQSAVRTIATISNLFERQLIFGGCCRVQLPPLPLHATQTHTLQKVKKRGEFLFLPPPPINSKTWFCFDIETQKTVRSTLKLECFFLYYFI